MLKFNISDRFSLSFPLIAAGRRQEIGDAKAVDAGPSFTEVCEAYLAYLPDRPRNRSVPEEVKFFRRYVMNPDLNRWANKPMSQVTDIDVAGLIEALVRRGTLTLARNCLIKVRTMLSWAMAPNRRAMFGLNDNPALHLTPRMFRLKVKPRDRVLSRAEVRAYLLACEQLPRISDEVLGKCLLFVPCRLDDLTRSKWSDFDLDQMRWTSEGWSHSHLPPVQPLSQAGTALLEELRSLARPAVEEFVFGKGGSRSRSRMKSMIDFRMKRILGQAGIEFSDWRWNDLRRTALLLMLCDLNVTWEVARIVVGRTSNGFSTFRRDHPAVRDAVERLAQELVAIRDGIQRPDDEA